MINRDEAILLTQKDKDSSLANNTRVSHDGFNSDKVIGLSIWSSALVMMKLVA
jgi:hypothetical protein